MDDEPTHASPSRMRRVSLALVTVAVLIPAVPIAAGFVITSRTARAGKLSATSYSPVTPTPPAAKRRAGLLPGSGALVAVVVHPTTMRSAPGGRRLAKLATRTEFRSPEALWVVRHTGSWLGVVSALAGNGQVGWIPKSAASLSRVRWELRVSLSERRLMVLKDGKVLQRYTVAVGRPTAPTPTGRYSVTDRLVTQDPTGPYGCCILALSARSPHAIQGWSGGNRIAIHSTPDTTSIGQPVSHGCIRLTLAAGQWLLGHIPLGTPAIISG